MSNNPSPDAGSPPAPRLYDPDGETPAPARPVSKICVGYFVAQPDAVLFDDQLSHLDVRVYGVVATYAGRGYSCFPSDTTIGGRIGVSRQAVSGSLRQLETRGHIYRLTDPWNPAIGERRRWIILRHHPEAEGFTQRHATDHGEGVSGMPDRGVSGTPDNNKTQAKNIEKTEEKRTGVEDRGTDPREEILPLAPGNRQGDKTPEHQTRQSPRLTPAQMVRTGSPEELERRFPATTAAEWKRVLTAVERGHPDAYLWRKKAQGWGLRTRSTPKPKGRKRPRPAGSSAPDATPEAIDTASNRPTLAEVDAAA